MKRAQRSFFVVLQSPRVWMLLGALLTRAAGFITSFALARFVGAEALGIYAATVNTASSVVSPFSGVMANNATVMASAAVRSGDQAFALAARANMAVALALAAVSLCVFGLLASASLSAGIDRAGYWVIVGGASVVIGQVSAAVLQGFHHGAGRFIAVSRAYAVVAVLAVLGLGPALWFGGLQGALGLLVAFSLGPVALMAHGVLFSCGGRGAIPSETWREVFRRLRACIPSIGATAVNAAVNWLCAIFLVQQAHGLEGVAVVAVALQWTTLVLMPATSWGGVTLKSLSEALHSGEPNALRTTMLDLMKKNVVATLMLGGGVAALASVLANAYGLVEAGLGGLLVFCALGASVASLNNVFERLLLCLDKQHYWFLFSSAGYVVQLLLTYALIDQGMLVFAAGVLSASLTLNVLCWIGIGRWLPKREGAA